MRAPGLGGSVGCGLLLIPIIFFGGTWVLGKLVDLLTFLFG